MRDRPTPDELLEAVAEFLAADVRPKLDPHTAFRVRVAENAIAIVRRELSSGAAADEGERAVLQSLLNSTETDIAKLNLEAARNAFVGYYDNPGPRHDFIATMRKIVGDKLAIDNPRYADDSKP